MSILIILLILLLLRLLMLLPLASVGAVAVDDVTDYLIRASVDVVVVDAHAIGVIVVVDVPVYSCFCHRFLLFC